MDAEEAVCVDLYSCSSTAPLIDLLRRSMNMLAVVRSGLIGPVSQADLDNVAVLNPTMFFSSEKRKTIKEIQIFLEQKKQQKKKQQRKEGKRKGKIK